MAHNYSPREVIWQGSIEWTEKSRNDGNKTLRHLGATIMANLRDGDAEVYVY